MKNILLIEKNIILTSFEKFICRTYKWDKTDILIKRYLEEENKKFYKYK
jgi:hypothetical protein